jgi:hypothetical protein
VANNEVGFQIKVNGVDTTVKSLTELEQAIRDLTKEAKAADYGSKQFEEITGRIQQAKAAVREFKNDTRTKEVKDQFNDLAGGIAGSFDVAEGALKSFGVESKALGAISSTAQGLISAALNARQIAELKVDAAVALRTTREKAAAAGTAILNVVNKAFNLTLSLNPIGIIVTALGLLVVGVLAAIGPLKKLISSFDFLTVAVDAVIATFRNVASFLSGGLIDDAATAKTRSNADKMITALDDVGSAANKQIADSKRRLALMEAQGATEEQLLAQKKKINKEEVASRQAAVDQLIKLQQIDGELDDDKKKKLAELQVAIKDLNNQAAIDEAAYNKKKADAAKAAGEKSTEKEKERKDKYNEHLKEIQKATEESDKKIIELRQKAEIDAIKDADLKAQKELEIQQKNARDLLQVEINKIAKKKALTAEEQKYLNSLYSQQKQLGTTQAQETQNLLDEQAKVKKEKEATFQKELEEIKSTSFLMGITNLRERARQELQVELDKQIAEVNSSELTATQKEEKINAIKDVSRLKRKEQDTAFAEEDRQAQFQFNEAEINDTRNSFEQRIALVDENLKLINDSTVLSEQEKTAAIKANADQRKAIEMAELEYRASIATAGMDLAAQAGQFLQQIAGKNKAVAIAGIIVEQAAAIGKIVANTAVANAKSVATFPITAGMPWVAINTISAGLSIASTIAGAAKSIREINAAGGGDSSGGSMSAPAPAASKFAAGGYVSGAGTGVSDSIPAMLSNGESVINANSTAMFGGLLNQINQAGGGAPIQTQNSGGNNAAPIFKTYVVASDMSSQQEADKRINDLAKI